MPLEPDERREVAEMIDIRIDKQHENVVMPLHRDNLGVQNSFRSELRAFGLEVQALTLLVKEFFAELRGAEKQRLAATTSRDRKAQYIAVIATVILVIVTAIGIYVATRPANSHIISHDPGIPSQ